MNFGRCNLFLITLLGIGLLLGCQGNKGAGADNGGGGATTFGPCVTANSGFANVTEIIGGSFLSAVSPVTSTSGAVTTPVPATPGKIIEVTGTGFQCGNDVEINFGGSTVTATPITVNASQIIFAFPAIAALGLDYTAAPASRVMDLGVVTDGGTFTIIGAFYLPKILLVDNETGSGGASNTFTSGIWSTAMDTLLGSSAYDIIPAASADATTLSANEVVIWFTGGNGGASFGTGFGTPPSPSSTERSAIETFIGTTKTPFPGVDISGICVTTSLSATMTDAFPIVTGTTLGPPPAFGIYSGWFDVTSSSFFAAMGGEQLFYNFSYYYATVLAFGSTAWYVGNTTGSSSILSTLPAGYAFTCSTPIWGYFASSCANVFPMVSLYAHMEAFADFLGGGTGTGLSPGFTPVWSFTAGYYGTTCEGLASPPEPICPPYTCSFYIADGSAGFGTVQSDDFPKTAM
ncbi:MAG: hypothetical protein AABZ60_23365, partial [Planctomycetota bacterium]